MLQGMMGSGQPDTGGMGGEEEQGGPEMPPPGAAGGQPPMPGMGGGEGEEEQEPEEDERAMHGQKPVRMQGASTGMPGPSNTFVPGMSNKPKHSKMSRETMANRTREDRRDKIIRDLRIQNSRMKAKADIQQLEQEGVVFGPTPELADKIKYQRMEELTLAYLHDEDSADEGEQDTYVSDKIEEMRTCYARRKSDPARRSAPNQASVARYSRTETDVAGMGNGNGQGTSDDDFEDRLGAAGSFEGISEFAEMQAKGKSRQEAIKYCRQKYGIR
jgi:hypothetical protein